MKFSIKGTDVPHFKNTANMTAKRTSPPPYVILPMSMHIGKPAKQVVKIGQHVDIGQLVGEQDGFISSPVYASISGTVKKCDDILMPNGIYVPCVMIESDGKMTLSPELNPPIVEDRESFVEAVRKSGIVGLGGAGFPTYVKFSIKDENSVDELIINGAECEPYITSDTRTMIDRADDIKKGIELVQKYLGIKKVIIAIEKNKPQAISKMKEIASKLEGVVVKSLPSKYPQGGEKIIIYNTTGKIVKPGQLPIDVRTMVCNCTTIASVSKYIETGIPLVEKCLTVDGGCVANKGNYIFPIGTPFKYLFEQVGGFTQPPVKIMYGGPMMGLAVPNLNTPVLKNTNAVIALNAEQSVLPKETPCIRCGRCVNSCPIGLRPTDIFEAYKAQNGERLNALDTLACMECGTCSYVCPAKRPLVQNNKLAKVMLKEYLAKEKRRKEEMEDAKPKSEDGKRKSV